MPPVPPLRPSAPLALLVLACSLAGGACSAPPPRPVAPPPPPPPKEGALLLALPGSTHVFLVPNARNELVRGRTRWHLGEDGTATRARRLGAQPIDAAVAVPSWLGGGMALLGERGLSLVAPDGTLRPIVRGSFTSLSVGAAELWTRTRPTFDWVRIDVAKGTATLEPPPIAAPIAAAWSSSGAAVTPGRVASAGPEFTSEKSALAIVDVLGPVRTQDGGLTWSQLDEDAVRAAFPRGAPTRIFREAQGLALADDERLVPVSSSGRLGVPQPIARAKELLPDVAQIRLEELAPFGVPLGGSRVLVADGPRLAIAALLPTVRILSVERVPDAVRCEVRKAPPGDAAVALASCLRRSEGAPATSARLDVGAITDATTLHFAVERSFSYTAQTRFAPSGAVAVAGPCAKGEEVHDFFTTARACVRDAKGEWREVALQAVGGFRRGVTPTSAGGLVVARDDTQGSQSGELEIVVVPFDARPGSKLARLKLGPAPLPQARVELAAIDEIDDGRVIVWREGGGLVATTLAISGDAPSGGGRPRVVASPAPYLYDAQSVWGLYGDRAIVARLGRERTMGASADAPPHERPIVDRFVVTRDGGAHFVDAAWPAAAPVLDVDAATPRLECGAYGCRVFGWARLGWSAEVLESDELVALDDAPTIQPVAPAPKKSTALLARCTSAGKPTALPALRVPAVPSASYAYSAPRDTLLGLGAPKVAPGQLLQLVPFARGAVRGGLIGWGPDKGAWGDQGHAMARFASDFDPLDVVHDSLPAAGLFADRTAFVRAGGDRSTAIALGPGRALFTTCELGFCSHVYRAVSGAPLERIDLSAAGEIVRLTNARELGGTLLVVGLSVPRERAAAASDPTLFVAVVTSAGVTVTRLGRGQPMEDASLVASADPVRRRLGLMTYSPLPTWSGGTTYVLPIDPSGKPASGFEALVAAPSELSRPHDACGPQAAWDRGEQNKRRGFELWVDGKQQLALQAEGVVVRERLSATGACLDRIMLLAASNALQLDASTGRALWLRIESDSKPAQRRELRCTLEWP
jgi:hypothetical protein